MDKRSLAVVTMIMFFLLVCGLSVLIIGRHNTGKGPAPEQSLSIPEETDASSSATGKSDEADPAAATEPDTRNIYRNEKYDFEIVMPENMYVFWEDSIKDHSSPPSEYGYQVHFASISRDEITNGYDGEWMIAITDRSQVDVEKMIAAIGDQFGKSRDEKREYVTINGIPAVKVVVTTTEHPDWHSESVIIVSGDYVYDISNGANKNDLFDDFYESFKIGFVMRPYGIYDMTDSSEYTEPCEGRTEAVDKDEQDALEKFYDDMSYENFSDAINMLDDSDLFEYGLLNRLFPRCSGGQTVMATGTRPNGIILLVSTGRQGEDTTTFLGFLTTSDDKILYYRERIKDYADLAEITEEFSSGSFSNKDLRKYYERFLSGIESTIPTD